MASDSGGATRVDVGKTVRTLREIRVKDEDSTVPPLARPLLTTLKHQLRDLIKETLDSKLPESGDLSAVRAALSAELARQGIVPETPGVVAERGPTERRDTIFFDTPVDVSWYGTVQEISISRISDHPDLIGATVTVGVMCGEDSSLYLFERNGKNWELILAQEANGYEEVHGAQGSFSYVVSTPSDTGQFFVVTKNVSPWCTSNWHDMRYQVMRVGPSPYQPRILLNRDEFIFIAGGGETIEPLPKGFEIRFDARQGIDAGVLIRRHVVRYQIEGDEVTRVPPFAFEPEGFLDEWIGMPWGEASLWVAPSASHELRPLHEKLRRQRKQVNFFTHFVFEPPACKVAKGEWQIGIGFDPGEEGGLLPKGIPKEAYFSVVEKAGSFSLKGVSTRGARKCTE